jgi:hypothetical protein
MDNSRHLPGYKYYVDADTGERPAVVVTFLDLVRDDHTAVNGVVFAVDEHRLATLDDRERNYRRREVTAAVHPPFGGRVWAYFGTAAARDRFERGPAVVDRAYLALVRDGFAQLGPAELARFDASTEPAALPVRDLRRIDIPT